MKQKAKLARLERRREGFEKIKTMTRGAFHRPGSMKR